MMQGTEDESMTLPSDQELRIKLDDVVWRHEGEEIVVLELATTSYLTLNGSGKLLWLSLVEGATIETLADQLAAQYQIPADEAKADASAFVSALTERNLLEGLE
jgi:hypothetical protein